MEILKFTPFKYLDTAVYVMIDRDRLYDSSRKIRDFMAWDELLHFWRRVEGQPFTELHTKQICQCLWSCARFRWHTLIECGGANPMIAAAREQE